MKWTVLSAAAIIVLTFWCKRQQYVDKTVAKDRAALMQKSHIWTLETLMNRAQQVLLEKAKSNNSDSMTHNIFSVCLCLYYRETETQWERELTAVWPCKLTLVWTDFRKSSIKVDMTQTDSLLAFASLHIGQWFQRYTWRHRKFHANKLW